MMRTPPRENRYFFLLELIRMPTSLEKLRSVGHGACAKSTLSVSEKIKKYVISPCCPPPCTMGTTSNQSTDPPDRSSSVPSADLSSDNRRSKDRHGSHHHHHHDSRNRDHRSKPSTTSSGGTSTKPSNNATPSKQSSLDRHGHRHRSKESNSSSKESNSNCNSPRRGLRIFIGTANLGNADIDPSSLSSWLPSHGRVCHVLPSDVSACDDGGGVVDSHGQLEVIAIATQESVPGNRPVVTSGITSLVTGATSTPTSTSTTTSTAKKNDKDHKQQRDATFQNAFGTLGKPVDDLVRSLGKPVDQFFDGLSKPVDDLVAKTNELIVTSSKNSDLPVLSGYTKRLRTSIQNHIGDDYQCMVDFQRGEMMLFLFLRKDLVPASRVESIQAENTGLGRFLANKGGIAAVLTVSSTRLYFLAVHLQAHEGRVHYDGRNADLEEILKGTGGDPSINAHHAFVFGDLNYRIAFPTSTRGIVPTKEESWAVCTNLIRKRDWKGLRESDELEKALREKKILCGFRTPMCHFHPTFKLERRSGFHYDGKRTPSYTDRILWKSMQENRSVETLLYEPISSFATSDHKPIRGLFFLPDRRPLKLNNPDERRVLQLTFKKLKCKNLVPTPDLFQSDLDTFLQLYCEPKALHSHRQRPSSKPSMIPPKTKTIRTSDRPSWPNEVHSINIDVLSDEDVAGSRLFVKSVLENKVLGNTTIGIAALDLEDLVRKSLDVSEWEEDGVERAFFRNGKEVGKCFFDLAVAWMDSDE
ncbi:hypothetical protein ACHAXS_014139 [Conticribra weissflogii]